MMKRSEINEKRGQIKPLCRVPVKRPQNSVNDYLVIFTLGDTQKMGRTKTNTTLLLMGTLEPKTENQKWAFPTFCIKLVLTKINT